MLLKSHISSRLNEPSRSSLDTLIHISIQQEHFYGAIVFILLPRNIILKEEAENRIFSLQSLSLCEMVGK